MVLCCIVWSGGGQCVSTTARVQARCCDIPVFDFVCSVLLEHLPAHERGIVLLGLGLLVHGWASDEWKVGIAVSKDGHFGSKGRARRVGLV